MSVCVVCTPLLFYTSWSVQARMTISIAKALSIMWVVPDLQISETATDEGSV